MLNLIERLLNKKPRPVADERIRYRKQKFDYDCSQTCLDMLGYDGHGMLPERVGESRIAEIFGFKRGEILSFELSEDTYFDNPHFLTVMVACAWGYHAVIAYKDQIYCPSLGIFKIPDYKEHIWTSITGFPIPFAEKEGLNLMVDGNLCIP